MKRNLSVMLKPTSSKCNLKCKYCFYNSISDARKIKDYGFMKTEMLKEVIKKCMDYCDGGECTIGFQGGEPLLSGIEFYKDLIKYINTNNNGTVFRFSVQTNGTLITEEYAKFFKENNILVGVSLDGTKDIHNLNRINHIGKESFNDVIKGINSLKKYDINFNILAVVTPVLAKKVESVYKFMKKNDFKYIQFIPCLDPIESTEKSKFSITPNEYGQFLIKLFDLWYKDVVQNNFISIRYFDNILGFFLGYNYESCDMNGRCSCQHIIESDGLIYPCDFYTYEKYSIGNILNDSFDEIHNKDNTKTFIVESLDLSDKCRKCKYYYVCRGGCKRFKENQKDKLNYLCPAYYEFFDYSIEKFKKIATKISLLRKN